MVGGASGGARRRAPNAALTAADATNSKAMQQADRRLRRAAEERHEHEGRRQPAARAEGAARRHEGVRPHGRDRRLGGRAGQDREGLDVQRHGARADGSRSTSATTCASCVDNKLPQSTAIHFHGIEVPNAMDGVPDVTQDPDQARARRSRTSSSPRARRSACTTRTTTRQARCPTACSASSQVGDEPLPAGHGPVTQEVPMVLNDAGVIGLSLNGKSFPATAPVIAQRRRDGSRSTTSTRACRSTRCTCTACRSS